MGYVECNIKVITRKLKGMMLMEKFDKKIPDIFVSIVLGYFSAALVEGDNNTVVLASIFWLLATMHYRNSKQTSKK